MATFWLILWYKIHVFAKQLVPTCYYLLPCAEFLNEAKRLKRLPLEEVIKQKKIPKDF